MVSNAALRLSEITMLDLPESEERRILCGVKNGCFGGMVAVVWYWLKLGDSVMWNKMHARNSRSRIFEVKWTIKIKSSLKHIVILRYTVFMFRLRLSCTKQSLK